ncbi:MAG: major Facilitator Superfamily protein [Hydrocarboniphaga sp.]|nr:major Facilitator Superfamily protein [Hydrocarboniphaga sp.]
MMGLSFASVAASSLGLFMEPLSQEFGWSRASIAGGLSVFAAIAVPLAPVAGGLIDRWGSRRLAIPGVIVSATMLAAFSLANGSIAQWLILWALYALAAVSIKAPVWTTAVTGNFSAGRGMALAATLCGTAVAQTLSPIITQYLISTQGWRTAYVCLGFGWGAVALVFILLFFFDARDRLRQQPAAARAAAPAAVALRGLSLREALRNPALIRIAVATLTTNILVGGILIHQVPLLKEHGLTATVAAAVAGSAGIASLCGKLFSGWLLDRWHGARIASISLSLPALACLLLLNSAGSSMLAMAAVIALGYTTGAQMQLCAYLTGRYGGLLSFGKIFGLMSGLTALGIGIGPVAVGLVFDRVGSYSPVLIVGVPTALLCGLLLARLGPYPDWTSARPVR